MKSVQRGKFSKNGITDDMNGTHKITVSAVDVTKTSLNISVQAGIETPEYFNKVSVVLANSTTINVNIDAEELFNAFVIVQWELVEFY